MYAEERQQAIADQVRANGRASVAALATLFEVTSETVRRDLAVLERAGHLQRVHGGAVRPGATPVVGEQGIDVRQMTRTEQKVAIGRAATRFLPPDGGSVFFDAGTTTFQAAGALPRDRKLTLITHSIPIAAVLAGHGSSDLHVLGGRVRGLTQATVGAETVAALERMRISTAFVGTNGISEAHGLSTPTPRRRPSRRPSSGSPTALSCWRIRPRSIARTSPPSRIWPTSTCWSPTPASTRSHPPPCPPAASRW
ncbi:HTH-type transcriptional repressor GlcR [Gordonia insulae]|uniref:Lactose phosphotransferase system repressor n=1 Tax=Gordonia insulae TaxID=2420509 RepID=A0A3G8JG79_9ACTN|nr:HTH-type transcriptional repressor GlcR [Gordonia insulae]